jgi:thioredoxin 1
MSKEIISVIESREAFFHLLENNPGVILLKLGAEWCGPCKKIKDVVHAVFIASPPDVICGDIDIDESFDFYGFLKSKKMVNGIPVMLCYKKGNKTFIPDESVTGNNPVEMDIFFKKCGQLLVEARMLNPPIRGSNR